MKLEEIVRGVSLDGVEPACVVTVSAAEMIGPASLQLIYKLPSGEMRERLLTRSDEATIAVATASRPWSFDGDAEPAKALPQPIPFADATTGSMQGPRYTSLAKLLAAKRVTDLFD